MSILLDLHVLHIPLLHRRFKAYKDIGVVWQANVRFFVLFFLFSNLSKKYLEHGNNMIPTYYVYQPYWTPFSIVFIQTYNCGKKWRKQIRNLMQSLIYKVIKYNKQRKNKSCTHKTNKLTNKKQETGTTTTTTTKVKQNKTKLLTHPL